MTEAKRQKLQQLLESDMMIRREYLGLQTQLAPFPQHCSCQRLMMLSSHCAQSVVLDNAEAPRIFTGMENVIGKYQFSTTRREQDIHILAIIPKFRPTSWEAATIDMPTHTVIYRGMNDNKINYLNVNRYTYLHDGFGYINECPSSDMLVAENILPKEASLQQSPAWRNGEWAYGLNANVAFLADDAVTEDAMVISESFAKKCTNLAIHRIKLNLSTDDVLLNLYGDKDVDEYKVMPGIGETVRSDGVLAAIRAKNTASYVSDMTMDALQRIEPMHDELHKAPPGSKILDIDVYVDYDQLRKMDPQGSVYEQLIKIYQDHQYYYDEVIRRYREYVDQGLEISEDFNTLVLRCMELTSNRKYSRKGIKLCDPREPIEFITVVITYSYEREISLGSKLTGREGGKGVVSEIRPDECMPVDAYGVRADVIMTPASTINRMNPSQFFEQFWNRISDQVVSNAKAANMDWKTAYKYFIGFCNDWRPAYAEALDTILLDTESRKKAWVDENMKNGYIRLLSAWTKGRPYGYLNEIAKKYGYEPTPVTYQTTDEVTGKVETITTEEPVLIGSKYFMYLGKIPDDAITAIEMSYVNQFEIPIKPKSKRIKEQSLVGITPQKFGEDEVCMLNMSLGDETVARLMCIHSAAPTVAKKMAATLLRENEPTKLLSLDMTTHDIISQNRNCLIFADMMGAIGYDVRASAKSS